MTINSTAPEPTTATSAATLTATTSGKDSTPLGYPSRVTVASEAFSGLIDYLFPDARRDYIDLDTTDLPYLRQLSEQDEPAIALIEAIHHSSGLARRQFEQALTHGIDTVEKPMPDVTAFFHTVDPLPAMIDMRLVDDAKRALRRIDPITTVGTGWTTGFLLAAILPNTARTLAASRRSVEHPGDRLVETVGYVSQIYKPGSYERFGPATATACRLRVMHAALAVRMRKTGQWDDTTHGAPVSLADLYGGALASNQFTYLAARAEGYRFTNHEREAIAHLAACTAYRHGIPAHQLSVTPADLDRFIYTSLRSARGLADPTSLNTLIPPLTSIDFPNVPPAARPLIRNLLNGYARLILDDPLCHTVGIPNSRTRHLIPLLRAAIRTLETTRTHANPLQQLANHIGDRLWDRLLPKAFHLPQDQEAHFTSIAT